MSDLESIVKASIDQATGEAEENSDGYSGSDDPMADETVVSSTDEPVIEADISPSSDTVVAEPEKKPDDDADELEKELAALGIHPPVEGQRENRLPYSRMVKIFRNAQKKWVTAHQTELKERDTKLTASQERLQNMEAVDKLIANDPDRYLRMLAAIHPDKYSRFLDGSKPTEVKSAPPVVESSPPPAPDAEFPDGSKGYSPEGLQKLLAWQAQQVETRTLARADETFTRRFGPIEQRWKNEQVIEERRPMVQAMIARNKKVWGEHFKDGDPEILKFMNDHPEVPFDAAVSQVLVPRIQAERNTMRADILKEINTKPKAAAKSAPTVGGGGGVTGPRSLEDIVRESIANHTR